MIPLPLGTNGGVTATGIACSALGGLVIGLAYYVVILIRIDNRLLSDSPDQWPLVFVGLFGGLLGSLLDSILGAVFQYSGIVRTVCPSVQMKRFTFCLQAANDTM